MAQLGHTDAALSLEVYTKVIARKRELGERVDALMRPPDELIADPALAVAE